MHASLSEDGILGLLARHFPATHPSLLLGRGDDCAILRAGRPLCVSSDLFLEDIHFRRAYFTPEDTGYKALAANVSDIAACGGRPLGFSLCLGLPAWADAAWLDAFFAGMAGLAFAIWLEGKLVMPQGLFPPMLLPAGLTTVFCGLILIVGRIKAITQVIGYLVAENGIFLLGVPLMTAGTVWFELALLLDVFVAVFVMGIAINHISDSFASIDVAGFRSLRD